MFDAMPVPENVDMIVMGVSKHAGDGVFNEVNPGVGIWIDLDNKNAIISGVYNNSYNRTTVYAGGSRHIATWGPVQVRADFGLATGYQDNVIPMLLPVVELHTGVVVTRAMIIPAISDDTVNAVGIQWRIKL